MLLLIFFNACNNHEWTGKIEYYNTEMPLALVCPHICCLTSHVYNLYLNLKKRNKEKKGLCPCIWLHRLHTVTTWWTWLKWCTLSDMGRGRQRKIGGQFHVYKQTNKQNNSFSEISYLCFPPNKLDNFLTAFCAVTLGSVLGWLLATGRAEGVLSWLEWRHKPVTMII